jgi:hypothetical protein
MIDFIRIKFKNRDAVENFIITEGNFNEVIRGMEIHSKALKYPMRAKFINLDIVVTEYMAYLKNSLHKYYNLQVENIEHNHNDFSFKTLCKVIDEIEVKFPFINDSQITQLEFGFNIETDISAEQIINNSHFLYRGRLYNHNKQFKGKGEFLQFDTTNYYIKIYDKAKQYKVSKNILRIEIKYVEKAELVRLNILNLSQLKDKKYLRILYRDFVKKINDLIIVDSYEKVEILPKDRLKLIEYSNPKYWYKLKSKRQTKSNRHNDFKKLLKKYYLDNTKRQLTKDIFLKYNYLINN